MIGALLAGWDEAVGIEIDSVYVASPPRIVHRLKN
jgi:hypothetical protein